VIYSLQSLADETAGLKRRNEVQIFSCGATVTVIDLATVHSTVRDRFKCDVRYDATAKAGP